MFHDCLTLLGEGPWEIDTDIILNKQPDSYWAAYKLHDTWYAEEMVGGHARLNVPAGTFAANNEIELLIGYGKNPTVPVELSSFTATINAENYVLLTWVSQSESNISGYNVYRNTSDDLSSAIKIRDLIWRISKMFSPISGEARSRPHSARISGRMSPIIQLSP